MSRVLKVRLGARQVRQLRAMLESIELEHSSNLNGDDATVAICRRLIKAIDSTKEEPK